MQIIKTPYVNHAESVPHSALSTRRNDGQAANATKKTETATVSISSAGRNAEDKWQEIADKYDMTNISANEIMGMAEELYDNKLISSSQMLDMYTLPSIDFNPDEKINYVAHVTKELESLKSHNDGSIQMKNAIEAKSRVFDIVKRIG
ncbi:MAG: hypothetical protein COA36_13400 [Desulfotalea sp.]|nr:MAG: hypothetical protein COA36_13400 [Desulfotalea sp.]